MRERLCEGGVCEWRAGEEEKVAVSQSSSQSLTGRGCTGDRTDRYLCVGGAARRGKGTCTPRPATDRPHFVVEEHPPLTYIIFLPIHPSIHPSFADAFLLNDKTFLLELYVSVVLFSSLLSYCYYLLPPPQISPPIKQNLRQQQQPTETPKTPIRNKRWDPPPWVSTTPSWSPGPGYPIRGTWPSWPSP
jgi:hypothetical protein